MQGNHLKKVIQEQRSIFQTFWKVANSKNKNLAQQHISKRFGKYSSIKTHQSPIIATFNLPLMCLSIFANKTQIKLIRLFILELPSKILVFPFYCRTGVRTKKCWWFRSRCPRLTSKKLDKIKNIVESVIWPENTCFVLREQGVIKSSFFRAQLGSC